MDAIARKKPKSDDQSILNTVIKKNLKGKIKYNILDPNEFQCGKKFYEDGRRFFADTAKSCKECIVVHNNWIVTKAAKIYRQKEMLQWVYDDGGYYSDPLRKYLTYANSEIINPSHNLEEDKQALINAFAIGKILNRTVILPRLFCKSSQCPWNSKYYISHIDDKFGGKYRESVFLKHPKVPESTKNNISETFTIKSAKYSKIKMDASSMKIPADVQKGATSDEIKKWFGRSNDTVLKFHSLYGVFKGFTNPNDNKQFNHLAKEAFKKAVYRQY